jgi:hypothetical protein
MKQEFWKLKNLVEKVQAFYELYDLEKSLNK